MTGFDTVVAIDSEDDFDCETYEEGDEEMFVNLGAVTVQAPVGSKFKGQI